MPITFHRGGSQGASVSGSTFVGNTSGGDGGAIDHLGGTLTLTNDTVIINVSNAPAGGGGIFKQGGTVILARTFVRGNRPDNCVPLGSVAGCNG